jgi:hypothetical protein
MPRFFLGGWGRIFDQEDLKRRTRELAFIEAASRAYGFDPRP